MLRYLQGTVETVEGPLVVLDVQGWGFELQVSRPPDLGPLWGKALGFSPRSRFRKAAWPFLGFCGRASDPSFSA